MQFIQHLAGAGGAALLLSALPAQAHICMEAPASRVGPSCNISSAQKPGPCGINTRSTKYVTEFRPGQTITVTLNETVNHDSHYRIAFNPNGASFEDPTGIDDKSGNHPFVLADGIKDESAARQSVMVTLPNMTCDNCTLQLIQVMYDKTGNGFGNDDIYYACADIVLKGTPSAGDAGVTDGGAFADASARPAPDSGAGAPVPPLPDAGTGSPTDAGSATTGGSDAAMTTTGGTGSDSGADSVDASTPSSEEDEDDGGGCTITPHVRQSQAAMSLALAALASLIFRRRRRS